LPTCITSVYVILGMERTNRLTDLAKMRAELDKETAESTQLMQNLKS